MILLHPHLRVLVPSPNQHPFFLKDSMTAFTRPLVYFTFSRSTLEKLLKHENQDVRDLAYLVQTAVQHHAPVYLDDKEETTDPLFRREIGDVERKIDGSGKFVSLPPSSPSTTDPQEGTVTPMFLDLPGEVSGEVVHMYAPPAEGIDLREYGELQGFRFISSPYIHVSCECGWLVVDGHPYRKLSWKERIQLFLHIRSVHDLRLNPLTWKQPPNDLH